MSAIIFESQYAGKDMPEMTYICLKLSTLSITINETMAHGIKQNAKPTYPAYPKAFYELDLKVNWYIEGKGTVSRLKSTSTAVFKTD